METVASADGTTIAYDRHGDGPPLVTAAGAFCARLTTDPLARALAERLTVLNYDRRGRGDSGDTAPYAVEREIDDLAALIGAAGGSAAVFGHSSGATLALKAAASGLPITHLVLYEPPFNPDGSFPRLPAGLAGELAGLVADGRRGEAVELRHAPFRPGLEAIAHTLAYDAAIIGDRSLPAAMLATITIPALVITGEQSPPFLIGAARATAAALPAGQLAVLPGQTHDINPEATAPAIIGFLS